MYKLDYIINITATHGEARVYYPESLEDALKFIRQLNWCKWWKLTWMETEN